MDIDRYIVTNRTAWGRLAALTDQARRKPASLSTHEVREFLSLQQRAASQLSFARGRYNDPALISELTGLVANANAVIYRRTASPTASLRRFFTVTFPAAVWHMRRAVAISAAALILPMIASALWLSGDADRLESVAPEAMRAAYVAEDFEAYYRSAPAGEFATTVLINNIQVSFTALALGITAGIGSVLVIAFNGLNLGVSWALFIDAGQQGRFFGLIIPHGLLEMSAAVLAGAAGMAMGFALIDPGQRTRAAALIESARRAMVVVLGLVIMFILAGLIEGFVTPGLPLIPRITIGVVVQALFISYIVAFGTRAEAAGFTGVVNEQIEGATAHEFRAV